MARGRLGSLSVRVKLFNARLTLSARGADRLGGEADIGIADSNREVRPLTEWVKPSSRPRLSLINTGKHTFRNETASSSCGEGPPVHNGEARSQHRGALDFEHLRQHGGSGVGPWSRLSGVLVSCLVSSRLRRPGQPPLAYWVIAMNRWRTISTRPWGPLILPSRKSSKSGAASMSLNWSPI